MIPSRCQFSYCTILTVRLDRRTLSTFSFESHSEAGGHIQGYVNTGALRRFLWAGWHKHRPWEGEGKTRRHSGDRLMWEGSVAMGTERSLSRHILLFLVCGFPFLFSSPTPIKKKKLWTPGSLPSVENTSHSPFLTPIKWFLNTTSKWNAKKKRIFF